MKQGFWIIVCWGLSCPAIAQKLKRADKAIAAGVASDMAALGADSVSDGHTAGGQTPKVCAYVSGQFEQFGMVKVGEGQSFVRAVKIDQGWAIGAACALSLDGKPAVAGVDFFPLVGSPDGHAEGSTGISLNEGGLPWIYDLKYDLEGGKDDSSFNLHKILADKAKEAKKKGGTALLLYNSSKIPDNLVFNSRDSNSKFSIPIVYISRALSKKAFKDPTAYIQVALTVATEQHVFYVHHVEGLIDNGAPGMVVIKGSLDTSGSAVAIVELARLIRQAGWRKHNYLFLGYSGGPSAESSELTARNTQHPDIWKHPVDYDVEVSRIIPDPGGRILRVTGFSAPGHWDAVFGKVKDPFLQVSYVDGGAGPVSSYPFFVVSAGTSVVPQEKDYNNTALAVRYVFKLLEAAEKQ
jgi:aminopeptidase YwaD